MAGVGMGGKKGRVGDESTIERKGKKNMRVRRFGNGFALCREEIENKHHKQALNP